MTDHQLTIVHLANENRRLTELAQMQHQTIQKLGEQVAAAKAELVSLRTVVAVEPTDSPMPAGGLPA